MEVIIFNAVCSFNFSPLTSKLVWFVCFFPFICVCMCYSMTLFQESPLHRVLCVHDCCFHKSSGIIAQSYKQARRVRGVLNHLSNQKTDVFTI